MGKILSRLNSLPFQKTSTTSRNPNHPRHTTRPHSQPTAGDVASYIAELTELSTYLDKLDELTSGNFVSYEVAGEVLDLDDETMDSYLEALTTKANQLNGIRKLLQRHPNISGADVLTALLDDVEPKCRQMRDKLSRLRSTLVTETSGRRKAASTETQAQGGSDRPGPSGLCSSTSATTQTDPNQRGPTGSNYSTQSPASSVSDVASSVNSDEEESKSEEEEASGHRRSSTCRDVTVVQWRGRYSKSNVKRMKVTRSGNLLDQMIPWYAEATTKTLMRIFAVTFAGESGMDMGALTKEFFFIVFEAVISGTFKGQTFLEGKRGHLIPNAMTDCRLFAHLGRMIVHAIINDCKGLSGLSPAIVHYLVSGKRLVELEDTHPPLDIEDVADPQLKQLLQKYEKLETFSPSEEDAWMNWMQESNCKAHWKKPDSRHYVIQQLLLYYVFMKRIRQIQALEAAIETLGLKRLLINNATKENISEVFPSDDSTAYTPDVVTAIVITRGNDFDPSVLELFKQFMQDLHDGRIANFRLCDLIQFVSSSPYLPERLVVSFSPDIMIPVAHACYSEITLPLAHQTYPKFKDAMVTALQNGLTGFQLQ